MHIDGPPVGLPIDPDPERREEGLDPVGSKYARTLADDAPLEAADPEEDVGYPAGADVDSFGRCKFVGDPDAVIHDPVALDRAWRLVREEDLGQYGGYSDSPAGKAKFTEDWKAALDQRVDLVDTLAVGRWRENQQRARLEQRIVEEKREKAQVKAGNEAAAYKQVLGDLQDYSKMLAQHDQDYAYMRGSGEMRPPVPEDFATWQRKRLAERAHDRHFGRKR
jgi:hypothetical protein